MRYRLYKICNYCENKYVRSKGCGSSCGSTCGCSSYKRYTCPCEGNIGSRRKHKKVIRCPCPVTRLHVECVRVYF